MAADDGGCWQASEAVHILNVHRVHLVVHIQARHVPPVALNDVNQLVAVVVAPEQDIGIVDLVLVQNAVHSL